MENLVSCKYFHLCPLISLNNDLHSNLWLIFQYFVVPLVVNLNHLAMQWSNFYGYILSWDSFINDYLPKNYDSSVNLNRKNVKFSRVLLVIINSAKSRELRLDELHIWGRDKTVQVLMLLGSASGCWGFEEIRYHLILSEVQTFDMNMKMQNARKSLSSVLPLCAIRALYKCGLVSNKCFLHAIRKYP